MDVRSSRATININKETNLTSQTLSELYKQLDVRLRGFPNLIDIACGFLPSQLKRKLQVWKAEQLPILEKKLMEIKQIAMASDDVTHTQVVAAIQTINQAFVSFLREVKLCVDNSEFSLFHRTIPSFEYPPELLDEFNELFKIIKQSYDQYLRVVVVNSFLQTETEFVKIDNQFTAIMNLFKKLNAYQAQPLAQMMHSLLIGMHESMLKKLNFKQSKETIFAEIDAFISKDSIVDASDFTRVYDINHGLLKAYVSAMQDYVLLCADELKKEHKDDVANLVRKKLEEKFTVKDCVAVVAVLNKQGQREIAASINYSQVRALVYSQTPNQLVDWINASFTVADDKKPAPVMNKLLVFTSKSKETNNLNNKAEQLLLDQLNKNHFMVKQVSHLGYQIELSLSPALLDKSPNHLFDGDVLYKQIIGCLDDAVKHLIRYLAGLGEKAIMVGNTMRDVLNHLDLETTNKLEYQAVFHEFDDSLKRDLFEHVRVGMAEFEIMPKNTPRPVMRVLQSINSLLANPQLKSYDQLVAAIKKIPLGNPTEPLLFQSTANTGDNIASKMLTLIKKLPVETKSYYDLLALENLIDEFATFNRLIRSPDNTYKHSFSIM